jgi:hypothetical protein
MAADDDVVSRSRESYICECSDAYCTAPILMTRAEYESVRAVATNFAIAPNHENPELDRVIDEHERFSRISVLPGAYARMAIDTDPRGPSKLLLQ